MGSLPWGHTCLEWVGVRERCSSAVADVWAQYQALRGRCMTTVAAGNTPPVVPQACLC
jgi:hypothetical protein